MDEARQRLRELQAQLEEMRQQLSDQHPRIVAQKQRIAEMEQQMAGQQRQPARGTPGMMPAPDGGGLDRNFFPPELIMQHQKAIGLTTDQQTAIRGEMQKMMARFTDLQWQQSAETEAMSTLLNQPRPDEKEAMSQLDKLMNIENEIKRLHTGMLIRLKNQLTPEQQGQLRQLMHGGEPRPRGGAGDEQARERNRNNNPYPVPPGERPRGEGNAPRPVEPRR
jgi:Spy/CpxP family protein refolding chaperone